MAITWLIEWRILSSCSLSLVRGRLIAVFVASGLLPAPASPGLCGLEAMTGTGIRWC
ncbi:MAG: hypothetical protein ACKO0M_11620 [Cyanobium sp.]